MMKARQQDVLAIMEVKPAALCCKTCSGPSLTLLLKALQVWGLAGPSVMPADKLGWAGLGEAVISARAGDSRLSSSFSGELP